jgi:hypothetical protein
LGIERASMKWPKACLLAWLMLCACAPALASPAVQVAAPERRPPNEVEVEAAYLVNFLRYTQWPASSFTAPNSPYVVTVVGSPQAAASVRAVAAAAASVDGRPIEVRWLSQARGTREIPFDSPQDLDARAQLRGSPLVFFHRSAGPVRAQVLSDLASAPVLTVSDLDDFTSQGGMLALVRDDRRIVFRANVSAIRGAGLLVSAKVLKLARADARGVP